MADWIKMRSNLAEDPRVLALAEYLHIPELHAVGLLFRLWSWADQHSTDGNALSVTSKNLDRMVGVEGFAAALRTVGWLEGHDLSLSLPRFTEHNGQTAKQRALTTRRVNQYKKRGNAEGNAGSVTQTVTGPLPTALPDKIRVEGEYIPPVVPPSGGTSEGDEVPVPTPPVMVPEATARTWFEAMVSHGANFTAEDFDEAFRLLHSTRDVRTGCWRVGKSGMVSDPRPILEQRLHDARERRLKRDGQFTAGGIRTPNGAGSRAFVLRQQIGALEGQLASHKGNPAGLFEDSVKAMYRDEWRAKRRELEELQSQLASVNEPATP